MNERQPVAGEPRLQHPETCDIVRRLSALGLGVPAVDHRGEPEGEVVLRVSVDSMLHDDRYALKLKRRLYRFAEKRNRVCLLPVISASLAGAVGQWREFRERLGQLCPPSAGPPALCVPSHQLPLDEYLAATDGGQAAGTRYVYCDSLQMRVHRDRRVQDRTDANWRAIWRSRLSRRRLAPVYGGFVRSACPLLADEAAAAVLPLSGLNAPLRSAWLPLELDLGGFADDTGQLDLVALRVALDEAVPLADVLLGRRRWASTAQRGDAAENRRLALTVAGIGDLVKRRGQNPAELDCLRELHAELRAVRNAVDEASAREARRSGPLPALSLPPREWLTGAHGEQWRQRFEAARRRAAVRHRNLLAMSPYSVLPAGSACDPAFADLLPLLAFADAWAFADPPDFRNWNLSQFKYFHTRARAIIQASQVTARIAAGA
jgi:hypothetical protein